MKSKKEILDLIKDPDLRTKIKIYFSTKVAGDDYDPYEANYTFTNLNPVTILGYVHEFTPETAYYKQYGIHQEGMKEIITEEKYRNYFEKAARIDIDGIQYQNFKDAQGNRTSITKRPYKTIRVIVSRNG